MKNIITVAALLAAGTAFANAEQTKYWWQEECTDLSSVDSWKTDEKVSVPSLTDSDSICAIGGNGGTAKVTSDVEFGTLFFSQWANLSFEFSSVATVSASSIQREGKMGITIKIKDEALSALNSTGELVLFSSNNAFEGMDTLTRYWSDGSNFISAWIWDDATNRYNGDLVVAGTGTDDGIYSTVSAARTAIAGGSRPYAFVLNENQLSIVSSIPEPSAFGLLAGAGALALVAARRRRRKA